MRTLDANLTTAQQSSSLTPLIKIVLSYGGDTDTYTKTAILDIAHHEEPFNLTATVRIDNSGKALNAEDYKGYKAVISYGAKVGETEYYSATAPLYVVDQRFNSAVGILDCVLELAGVPNLLAYDSASAAYQPDEDNADTFKDLIDGILGATLACFNHCTAYAVQYDGDLDEIIDTINPEDSFRVSLGQSRAAALRWILDRTKMVMRWEEDEKFHLFKPTTSGESYDYEYSLDSGHTFFSKAYQESLVIPNKIYVMSDPDTDDGFSGDATDASHSILPFPKWYYHRVDSDAEAEDLAEAILSKAQLQAQIGAATIPIMNCGQEVFDYINITDSRQTKNRAGNIGSIDRHYQAYSDTTDGAIFDMTFSFGGWLSVRKILSDLEVYSDTGYYFNRLEVKDLYVENLLADNIDLISLDDINDGSTYSRVKSVHLDSGGIKIYDQTTFVAGYDPTDKLDKGDDSLDDVPEGTTYQRVLATDIAAGHIKLTSDTTYQSALYNPTLKIKTFYQDAIPTATVAGDLWIDTNDDNKLYRATSVGDDEIGGGEWILVQDSAAAAALATSKMKVFTAEPTTPYVVGDMWVDGTVFKRCITALASGAYNAAHWAYVDLDEIENGSTYQKLLATDISSGHIQLTSAAVFNGIWYGESGVTIDADQGIDLAGNDIRWFYSAGLVGNIYGISGGLYILGDDDVSINWGAGGGVVIGGATPITDDIIIDADTDVLIHGNNGIDISATTAIDSSVPAGEIQIVADDDTDIWAGGLIKLFDLTEVDGLDAELSSDDIGAGTAFDEITCDTLNYNGGSLPDDLDDLAMIKAIKNGADGKISIGSLPSILRYDHTKYMTKRIADVDRRDAKHIARQEHQLILLDRELANNDTKEKKYKKDEDDTPFEWDKVVKRDMQKKLKDRNKKLLDGKVKVHARIQAIHDDRPNKIAKWEERYIYVSEHFIPLNKEVELVLGGLKQLLTRVEALESAA